MAPELVCAVRAQTAAFGAPGWLGLGGRRRLLSGLLVRCGGVSTPGPGVCRATRAATGHNVLRRPVGKTAAAVVAPDSGSDRSRVAGGAVSPGGGVPWRHRRQSRVDRSLGLEAWPAVWDGCRSKTAGGVSDRLVARHFAVLGMGGPAFDVPDPQHLGPGHRGRRGFWRTTARTAGQAGPSSRRPVWK